MIQNVIISLEKHVDDVHGQRRDMIVKVKRTRLIMILTVGTTIVF